MTPNDAFKPVAIIPYYNHPQTIEKMVRAIAQHQLAVIVVDDGSNDTSAQAAQAILAHRQDFPAGVVLLRHAINQGKGAAMMTGLRYAGEQGYTHALQIDADGQHNSADIPSFLAQAQAHPQAMICGVPAYDASVPKGRLYGRYATHIWVWINTLSLTIKDSMCGFRVYPLAATLPVLARQRLGQRMHFDPEILVHLHWRGVEFVNLSTKVTYPEDGVSHFQLLRDNLQISGMHARLFFGMVLRLPVLLWRKVRP